MLPAVMNYCACHLRESAAFRLGLMFGAGGMAIAVMVLIAIFIHP